MGLTKLDALVVKHCCCFQTNFKNSRAYRVFSDSRLRLIAAGRLKSDRIGTQLDRIEGGRRRGREKSSESRRSGGIVVVVRALIRLET